MHLYVLDAVVIMAQSQDELEQPDQQLVSFRMSQPC